MWKREVAGVIGDGEHVRFGDIHLHTVPVLDTDRCAVPIDVDGLHLRHRKQPCMVWLA